MLMNGASLEFLDDFSGYLTNITAFSWNTVSLILLVYGLMNIVGNFIAGRMLSAGAFAG